MVNSPKSPVTKGSNGIATATVPNVCKMPGPPAPFVPTPLPNIGRSSLSPKGYSKKVKIEGKTVAIKGATFASQGDIASKGTGGGIVSSNTHGPTKFVGPGALDAKIEGKSIQLLSDPMLNNCGPSGNPPNSATLMGVIQLSGMVTAVPAGKCPVCGEDHGPLEESEESKADAGSLAGAFRQRLAWITDPDMSVSTMLGVVHCKCGSKKYADQSGLTSVEFCQAASGYEHPANVTYSYIASSKRAQRRARGEHRNRVKVGLGGHLGNSQAFKDTWAKAEERARYSKKSGPKAYPAGACAAQGALLLMMDDGAIAGAMTEEFFQSKGKPMGGRIKHIDLRSGVKEIAIEPFEAGDTVPPCRTCELIVPMMLCTNGKTKCH
ncbi:MAG: PAAR-like domain-containing protein [Myxococcota bacterium]